METEFFKAVTPDWARPLSRGLDQIEKRIAQLRELHDMARTCNMPLTCREIDKIGDILAEKIPTLEQAAQLVCAVYNSHTPEMLLELGIDEEAAETMETLGDKL
jgi:hypothetical protein